LLEKYDNKLDELQEDIEMRDLKIIEYEKDITSSKDRIKIDNMDEKIRFITQMLEKLKHIHNQHKSSEKKQGGMEDSLNMKLHLSLRDETPTPRKPLMQESITESIDKLTTEIMV